MIQSNLIYKQLDSLLFFQILKKLIYINQRNGFLIVSLFLCFAVSAFGNENKSSAGYKHFNLLHQDNSYNSDFSESFLQTELLGQSNYLLWRFALTYNRPNGGLEWGSVSENYFADSSSEFIGNIHFKDESLESSLNVSNKSKSVGIDVSWKENFDNKNNIATNFWWQPFEFIKGQFLLGRKNSFPSSSEIFYKYSSGNSIKLEGGKINWIIPNNYNEISMTIIPIDRVTLQYSFNDILFDPKKLETIQNLSKTYEVRLDGTAEDRKFKIEYMLKHKSIINFKYRKIELDSRLRSYYQDQIFGYFGIVNGSFKYQGFNYTRGMREISLYFGEAQGEIKGVIEAWPFLDGLLRFIGERRHFVSEAEAKWISFSWDDHIYDFKKNQLFGALDFYRIKPKASYASWRPLLFGFGIDDLRSDKLNIDEASLIRLELSNKLKYKNFQINMHVSQWVPLRIKKSKKSESDSSGSGNTPSSSSSGSSKTTGGFEFGLYLTKSF